VKDAVSIVGLGLLGWGCWLIAPPVAGIVIGTLLLTAGLAGHFMGKETRK
jgi:hypothetical protein